MKIFNTRSLLGCGLALALFAGSAQAAPITLTIDSASSSLTLNLQAAGGLVNITDTATASGTIGADLSIAEAGGVNSLAGTGGAIGFTDMNLSGPLVTVTLVNLGGTFLGGPVGGTGVVGTYNFDPTGLIVNLNQGILTSSLDGIPVDLSLAPLPLPFSSSSSIQITATDAGGGLFDIDFLLTISESGVIDQNGTPVTVNSSGTIAASGVLDTNAGTVPEPGSLLLTGLMLAGLSTLRRR